MFEVVDWLSRAMRAGNYHEGALCYMMLRVWRPRPEVSHVLEGWTAARGLARMSGKEGTATLAHQLAGGYAAASGMGIDPCSCAPLMLVWCDMMRRLTWFVITLSRV